MEQDEVLRFTTSALKRLGVPYALVGSFASGVWGESRFTQDIDIVIELDSKQVDDLCEAFPEDGFYVSRPSIEAAVAQHRPFNIIHPTSGNKIDFFVLGDASWAKAQIERSRSLELFPNCLVQVASPEDVILGKLIDYREGGSEKHLRDIASILRISAEHIDSEYIAEHASQLQVIDIWQQILDTLQSS